MNKIYLFDIITIKPWRTDVYVFKRDGSSKDHKENTLRKYELMTIFPLEEELSKAGVEGVKKVLEEFGAQIESEVAFGDRDLCYEVKKRNRGKFILFNINANPAKIVDIDRQFKLNDNLLKFMFVRVDE